MRFLASRLAADWFALRVDIVLDKNTASSAVDVDLKVDLCENWSVHFGDSRGIDSKHCRERIGILPRHDLQQRLALLRVRFVVNESDSLAITLVDCSRPLENGRDPQ